MITHIIFDNNGVLTTSDRELTFKKVSKFLGIKEKEVRSLISKQVIELDTGKISQNEFYSKVLKDGGFDIPVEDFALVHLSGYVIKPEVQEFAKQLKKKYKLSMLSNFGKAFWNMYTKWGLDEIFKKENVFVSSDLGMAKPDKEIYLEVLKKLNVKPEKCIFIDDNLENVKSAKSIGINEIQFKDLDSLRKELVELEIMVR